MSKRNANFQNKNKILVTWWGALDRGGPTVGDALSVINIEKALQEENLSYTIASDIELDCFNTQTVNWRNINPNHFSIHLFVCGPIIGGSTSFQQLMERFEHCMNIAVGVSILPKNSPDHWNPFDFIVSRDGLEKNNFDLSLSFPNDIKVNTVKQTSHNHKLTIGLCFRGKQLEYGEENSLHKDAEIIVNKFIQNIDATYQNLDTRLDRKNVTINKFFDQLQTCDIIITTRLHGLLLSLLYKKPIIALDQIKGGGKILSATKELKWIHSFSVEKLTVFKLEKSFNYLLSKKAAIDINKTHNDAVKLSSAALKSVIIYILETIKSKEGKCVTIK